MVRTSAATSPRISDAILLPSSREADMLLQVYRRAENCACGKVEMCSGVSISTICSTRNRFVSALLYVQWCMKSGGMWHLWKMVATEAKIYFGGLDRLEPG